MSRGATREPRHLAIHLAATLAFLAPLANLALAQVYRVETLLGDFDPLGEVPLAEAWVRHPSALAVDSEGSLYFVDRDTYRVRKVNAAGQVITVAGSGLAGYSGDGGPATSARLGSHVEGLAVDRAGNVYIADTENHRIRRVNPSGTISTIAGTGAWGTQGDGWFARQAGVTAVYGLAADAAGNLYIADTWDDRIRKIGTNGVITTVAGTGEEGWGGDGGPATEARLDKPRGVSVDAAGNIYIADSDNHRIRRVDQNGTITTIAGTGERGYGGDGGPAIEAALSEPWAVTVDSGGNVYVADSWNGIVRKVSPDGTIATVAGIPPDPQAWPTGVESAEPISFSRALAIGHSDELYIADAWGDSILRIDEQATIATFVGLGKPDVYRPGGAAVDSRGTVFLADTSNHRILKIDTDGVATTVAGSGEPGDSGDGGPAAIAEFSFPDDVALGGGDIYIADTLNHRIRKVDFDGIVTTLAGTGEPGYEGDGGPAANSKIDAPTALAIGADGSVYFADSGNRRVRRIDAAGIITTVAGNGDDGHGQAGIQATQSPLGEVSDVAVDAQGRIYFSEPLSNRVLSVDPAGQLGVAAGTGQLGAFGDGGPALRAQLSGPGAVAVSESGTLYIADTWNGLIRKVTTDGVISTIAGSGSGAYDGDGSPATMFGLQRPRGIAAVSDETVAVVDTGNNRIRVLTAEMQRPVITAVLNGASYAPSVAPASIAVVTGTGLAAGTASAPLLPQNLVLPAALLETSVTVADRTDASRLRHVARLYSVSPTEIRFLVPARAATGQVVVTVDREGSSSLRHMVHVASVAPGLFSANGDGRGVAAATAVRVGRNGSRATVTVSRFDAARQRYVAEPIDLIGDARPVYLTLYGTGFRGASGQPAVTIAGQPAPVESSGPGSGFQGVDELVVGPIPRSMRGPALEVVASVDGQVSNAVTIAVK